MTSLEPILDETNGESSPIYDTNSKRNEIPDFISFGEFVTLMWAIESDRQKKEAIFNAASTNFNKNGFSIFNQSRNDNTSKMDKDRDIKKLQNLFR